MKSKEEVIITAMNDFDGRMPSIRNWMKSRLNGIWENGYKNGMEQGIEVGKYQTEEAYKTGYVDGNLDVKNKLDIIDEIKQGEYTRGVKDAWRVALQIASMKGYDFLEMAAEELDLDPGQSVFSKDPFAVMDILNRYYEEKKEQKKYKLQVGDCVYDKSGNKCVVTNVDSSVHVIYPSGKTHKWKKSDRFQLYGHIDVKFPIDEDDDVTYGGEQQ